ncbi:MAG: hypothetical protein IKH09_10195 [Clostridia bacterium]|nr:hypothetical protein [Clostridia bacterium]
MKKTLALILAIVMTAALAVTALADSINPEGHTPEGTTVTVKKADASLVQKDGIISEGEYEKADIDVNENTTILHSVFWSSGDLDTALAMLPTMEYYFSWSDGQINVAVRTQPKDIHQVIDVETGDYPEDWFCKNTAFTISSDVKQTRDKHAVCNFYFAVAKRTDTGAYQVGYYGADQRGNSDSYIPQAGTDFVINYDGSYVILEWSIPFSEIAEGGAAGAGDSVYLSIGAESGAGDTRDADSCYAVSLGDFTYGVSQKAATNHAAFLLSDEAIPAPANPTPITPEPPVTPVNPDNPNPTPANPDNPTPADPGNSGTTPSNGGNGGNGGTAPRTGDPMIIMAAVAAVSAAGAFIVRKKRH